MSEELWAEAAKILFGSPFVFFVRIAWLRYQMRRNLRALDDEARAAEAGGDE